MKTFIIGTNDANQRFVKYLKKLLPNASVSFYIRCIRKKNITLERKKSDREGDAAKGRAGSGVFQ